MSKTGRWFAIIMAAMLMAALASACGGQNNGEPAQESSVPKQESAKPENGGAEQAKTQVYEDWTGHSVEVPTEPKRVIFHGETTGDFAALGISPVGIMLSSIQGTLTEEYFKDAADVGFPFSVEQATLLDPDLIIFGNSDEAQYEFIAKVAPTVTFDTFGSLDERLTKLGQLLGKQEEAKQWLEGYHIKEEAMWKTIREGGIGQEETATVLTMYPGNRLFAMASTGLSQILYGKDGFKATPLVQEAMDAGQGFVEISFEKLPEYAGDHLFVLTPVEDAAVGEMESLQDSQVWSGLDAVKNGKVYTFGLLEAYSDAMSREWLIERLPQALLQTN